MNQKPDIDETEADEFDFDITQDLYDNGLRKDDRECKDYIGRYLYPLYNGAHALVENDQVSIIQKETMTTVYLARFPDTIKKWYLTKTRPRKLILAT